MLNPLPHSTSAVEQPCSINYPKSSAKRCSHHMTIFSKKMFPTLGQKSKSVNWICSVGSLSQKKTKTKKNSPILFNIHSKNGFPRIIHVSSGRWNEKWKKEKSKFEFLLSAVMINLVGGPYRAYLLIISFPQTLKIAPTVILFSHTQLTAACSLTAARQTHCALKAAVNRRQSTVWFFKPRSA